MFGRTNFIDLDRRQHSRRPKESNEAGKSMFSKAMIRRLSRKLTFSWCNSFVEHLVLRLVMND